MPDIDPALREEIDGAMVEFWKTIEAQNQARNQAALNNRSTATITTECATLDNELPEKEIIPELPEPEKTEVFLAQEIDINANGTYDYGPPDVSGAEIGRVVIIADEVNVSIQITADGNPVLFGGSDTISASNEIKEVTADEGQIVSDDISFTFTFSPVTGAVASVQVYGLI